MKKFLLFSLLILSISKYSRDDAVKYAKNNYDKINHECGNITSDDYLKCTNFSYFGNEFCNYVSHGGDCANFVSQCLVFGGGHDYLNGTDKCRGYPCGFEETGARNLGRCLQQKGWNSTCGENMEPPIYIKPGDVLIYHEGGCDLNPAHAVIITEVTPIVKITGRSALMKDELYNYNTEKPYYQWLHYIDPELDDYGKTFDSYEYIISIKYIQKYYEICYDTYGIYSFDIYVEMNKKIDTSENITINLDTSSDKIIQATCTPYYAKIIQSFKCEINICVYPLNNIDIYLPINPPKSKKYGFKNWKEIIGNSPGISNKISKVTCLPKEKNIFIPSSIKSEGCIDNKNVFSIYGKWVYNEKDKKPFYLEFPLLILNENYDIAYCEYDLLESNSIKCELEGHGIIKFEETYTIGYFEIFKINKFSSSTKLEDCSIQNSTLNLSHHSLLFLIIFIILLL